MKIKESLLSRRGFFTGLIYGGFASLAALVASAEDPHSAETYLIDPASVGTKHGSLGCVACHGGDGQDFDERHEHRIREGVPDRREPPMADRADEQTGGRRVHHAPIAFATRNADLTPSSWNPSNQYAPQ